MAQNPVEEDSNANGTTIQPNKAALREISDKIKPSETSDTLANKITGTKRPNPSSPGSPLAFTYARRKPDAEQGKANGLPVLKNEAFKDHKTVQNIHDSQKHFLNVYNEEATEDAGLHNGFKKDVKLQIGSSDWKERFIQLQAFLKNCDQSDLEDYKKMLRSLTAAGRSKHAVELEKRAIHLLLEEGKELYRMEILNVLGKGSASSPAAQQS